MKKTFPLNLVVAMCAAGCQARRLRRHIGAGDAIEAPEAPDAWILFVVVVVARRVADSKFAQLEFFRLRGDVGVICPRFAVERAGTSPMKSEIGGTGRTEFAEWMFGLKLYPKRNGVFE